MELTMRVRKSYPGFTLGADLSVTGERIGIFGASGSGKSTVVNMLAGLTRPDSGEIVLDGETLFSAERNIDLRPEQRRIALVFQQHCLFPHLNVRNNLLYGLKRCPLRRRRIDFDALVAVLKLDELLGRDVAHLSGGEKQRVALGRGLLAHPRLLLMDEPLSALDDPLRFQIIPFLRCVSAQFGVPYLFISHSLVEMRLMTDSALVIENGALLQQTTGEELARSRMGHSPVGYINLLELAGMEERDGLYAYRWKGGELLLSSGDRDASGGLFELSSKDIILFKRHPEAVSARNLLHCRVEGVFRSAALIGVELSCGEGTLVSEIVPEAARELGIEKGSLIHAACKASAFRRLASA